VQRGATTQKQARKGTSISTKSSSSMQRGAVATSAKKTHVKKNSNKCKKSNSKCEKE